METAATPENETESPAVLLCSKCKEKPRADNESTNPWCTDCKTKYQREYMQTVKKMNHDHAFKLGVATLRSYLAGEFERLGSGAFTGYEIAEMVRRANPEITRPAN